MLDDGYERAGELLTELAVGDRDLVWLQELSDLGIPAGYPYQAAGGYACKTGVTSGTSCGPFKAYEVNSYFQEWLMKGCLGDSGSPVYISHMGFGLWDGIVNSVNGCVTNRGNQYVIVSGLPIALSELHVALN